MFWWIDRAHDAELMVKYLQSENERLTAGIKAVRALITDSFGVDGLHLNGDVAPWETLEPGGMFEEWLTDFAAAEQDVSQDV